MIAQGRKHDDEESQLLTHYQSAKSDRVGALALLLLLELLDLLILSLDLRLLCRQLLLHGLVLLLPRLHLVADQGAADQTYGSTNAGASAGISCGAANNRAQTGASKSSDTGALLPRR
jgi:hypothetical protein